MNPWSTRGEEDLKGAGYIHVRMSECSVRQGSSSYFLPLAATIPGTHASQRVSKTNCALL